MAETIQRSFTGGEISPALGARADLTKYQTGLARLLNGFVQPEGGVSNRAGFVFVGHTPNNNSFCRLVPFQFSTTQTYVIVFSSTKMYFVTNGGFVLESTPQTVENVTQDVEGIVTITGHGFTSGDEVVFTSVGGISQLSEGDRYEVEVVTANTFKLKYLYDGSYVNTAVWGAFTSGGNCFRVYSVAHNYADSELAEIRWTQSADVMTVVHPNHNPYELSRLANDNWTFTELDDTAFSTPVDPPTISTITQVGTDPATDLKTYSYKVTGVDADGKESLASFASNSGNISVLGVARANRLTVAPAGTGNTPVSYNIYKAESESSDVYGYIGSTKTLFFEDYNIAPDINDAPPEEKLPFSGADDKPSTVAYYQQRIIYGGSNANPEQINMSRISDYKNFRTSIPTKADDAIQFTMASQQVNKVEHIVSIGALLVLTSGGEWRIAEGQDQVLTPTTISARPQSNYGCASVTPIIVDNTAIFIQQSQSRIRDIGYTFESDSYSGSDLSVMAQHLFKGYSIVDMQFCQEPSRLVWFVRSDGKMLCLTYHREHRITGWSQHDTAGSFKSVASVKEGQDDILYACVERVIDGNTCHFVERLHERNWLTAEDAYCVDSGIEYDGIETTFIRGLRHLRNTAVSVLADGNVVENITVDENGYVLLPDRASKVKIGLPYTSEMKTLDIDSSQRMVKGKEKSIGEVVIKFYESRGGLIGSEEQYLQVVKPREQRDNYDALALHNREERVSVDSGWTQGGQIIFRQVDPLPWTVLSVSPDLAIG